LLLLVLTLLTGQDFLSLIGTGGGGVAVDPGPSEPYAESPEEARLADFVSFVLDDAQDTWAQLLPGYQPANLVLFTDAVESACGFAQSATGPFYCPGDQRVYIDLCFYRELQVRVEIGRRSVRECVVE